MFVYIIFRSPGSPQYYLGALKCKIIFLESTKVVDWNITVEPDFLLHPATLQRFPINKLLD